MDYYITNMEMAKSKADVVASSEQEFRIWWYRWSIQIHFGLDHLLPENPPIQASHGSVE